MLEVGYTDGEKEPVKPSKKPLSYQVFTNWDFRDRPEYKFEGSTIIASYFYNEKPNSEIFFSTMTGVVFVRCNLDNIKIPAGNILIELRIEYLAALIIPLVFASFACVSHWNFTSIFFILPSVS
jgi:hypothetical protein